VLAAIQYAPNACVPNQITAWAVALTCYVIIIIIIIISLLKQLTNRSHKTQHNEIRKKYTKEKQNVKLWGTRVNHGLNSQSGFMS